MCVTGSGYRLGGDEWEAGDSRGPRRLWVLACAGGENVWLSGGSRCLGACGVLAVAGAAARCSATAVGRRHIAAWRMWFPADPAGGPLQLRTEAEAGAGPAVRGLSSMPSVSGFRAICFFVSEVPCWLDFGPGHAGISDDSLLRGVW